ncbi:MAG: phosphoenolpyruvate--protein phosphotransferase [Deltaproteobacteria bacterium]|nr:phosphoenolpyruvate--protein phosphotransferase [Deltaproteobacteria bacterium]
MSETIRLRGIPASPGIAIAKARVVDRRRIRIPKQRISQAEARGEVDRFMRAVDEARTQLEAARAAIGDRGPAQGDHSLILQAHLLMLEDEMMIDGAAAVIARDLVNAEWALSRKMDEIKGILAGLGDAYFKERSEDVDFVGNRVLRNLLGEAEDLLKIDIEDACILVVAQLCPGEVAQMADRRVEGFAIGTGTRTSHVSIMLQALGIPSVVGISLMADRVESGDVVIVDGIEGQVIIRPDEGTVRDYEERRLGFALAEQDLLAGRDEPAVTEDGVAIALYANIELPAEAALCPDYGAEGIGLYRTEFLYLDRALPPDENEQQRTYRAVIETLAPRPVIFRTFDLGADKLPGERESSEANPALGLRAIRLGLKNRTMFKAQLRAMLRAAHGRELRVMFPMVSGLGELRQVNALLEESRLEVGSAGPAAIRVGCMIELPSAVLVAHALAREVDFFSIGTNDLIQYSLGIDRANDQVAYLYTPLHPAILRSIRMVVEAGEIAGIPVSMCGGMAAEPLLIPLLIGLGLRSLSMTPMWIPAVKRSVRAANAGSCLGLARQALAMGTSVEIEDLVHRHAEQA